MATGKSEAFASRVGLTRLAKGERSVDMKMSTLPLEGLAGKD